MKRTVQMLGAVIAALVTVLVGAYVLIESGEVVVLRATPGDGGALLARLWVVDHEGHPWLSTIDPSVTSWVAWLRTHESIVLERGGTTSCRRPFFNTDPQRTKRLNAYLHDKYRVQMAGSRLIRLVGGAQSDEGLRVWIRLDSCVSDRPGAAGAAASAGGDRDGIQATDRRLRRDGAAPGALRGQIPHESLLHMGRSDRTSRRKRGSFFLSATGS